MSLPNRINYNTDDVPYPCLEYWQLNAMIIRGSYYALLIDREDDLLGKATVFCSLDGRSELWQAEINRNDKNKAVIANHIELYRQSQVSLCLKNALETLPRTTNVISATSKWKCVLVN